jgi:hypothetical protein
VCDVDIAEIAKQVEHWLVVGQHEPGELRDALFPRTIDERLVIMVVHLREVAKLSRRKVPMGRKEAAVTRALAQPLEALRERLLVLGGDRPDLQGLRAIGASGSGSCAHRVVDATPGR